MTDDVKQKFDDAVRIFDAQMRAEGKPNWRQVLPRRLGINREEAGGAQLPCCACSRSSTHTHVHACYASMATPGMRSIQLTFVCVCVYVCVCTGNGRVHPAQDAHFID